MSFYTNLAAYSGALAIGLGAFGAHSLKGRVDPALIKTWETAAQYHLMHSVALLCTGTIAKKTQGGTLTSKLFVAGTVLFSGSLYLLVLTGEKRLGILTPVGGLTLMAAWLSIAL